MIIKEYKNKTVLKGMNMDELTQWCRENEHPVFRAQQIYQWMYRHGILSFDKMSNMSNQFREYLKKYCFIIIFFDNHINWNLV